MAIRRLPALLVNQIAAGEVIERPASVVKELIENSLDAGATRIEVAVEDGGRQLIRVSDDGVGITESELALAVASHATSKIENGDDLACIGTLGFRGEALASIASVSRLRISSRATRDGVPAEAGAVLDIAGEQAGEVRPAAGPPGTTIEVRDLFFNTPARRKFMRTAGTEFGHINDVVQRTALGHPGVAFKLAHNERRVLDLPGEADYVRRCVGVLGKDIAEGLLAFEHAEPAERGGIVVRGVAALPELARATTRHQYTFINSRPVRDRQLMHAVKEAYRGLIAPERHPMAVVFLTMPADAVDVNVHPAKAEVRFVQPSAVHGAVLTAVRQRLLSSDLTPSASVKAGGQDRERWTGERAGGDAFALRSDQAQSQSRMFEDGRTGDAQGSSEQGTDSGGSDVRAFVDYFRQMDPKQKGFVYQQVRQAYAEAGGDEQAENDADGQMEREHGTMRSASILQVDDSYVVTRDEHGLVIVDQHALHERVMFEQLRERIFGQGRSLESQRLLMPATFAANASQQALLEQAQPLLERIGVAVEPMGPEVVGVQGFASFLFDRGVEPVAFMQELVDKLEDGQIELGSATAEEAALHELLDMMACKAAVKAGDKLSDDELAALLAQREKIERSSNCPHGRPTTVRLTLRDLQKHFKRT